MNDLAMNDKHTPPNRRVFILLLDSFGIGASLDAEKYGDQGSDTLGHIAETCAAGKADLIPATEQANNSSQLQRQGTLQLPNLCKRGLAAAHLASTGRAAAGLQSPEDIHAKFGYAVEQSLGKDTPSGHWEIAGVPVMFEWGYFKPDYPSFPDELTAAFIEQCNLPGILGNKHASGTVILEELGAEHIASGKPIVYTSADSVFQIAAHEQHFGLDRLYEICEVARKLVDDYNIGRVIARPFIGEPGNFKRTGNRRDYATPPPAPTLLDYLQQAGREVISIGKIADIYAHSGLTQKIKASGNPALFDATLAAADTAPAGSLVFTNFVDFDSEYGHRRNVAGYAAALEYFDRRLPELEAKLQAGDMIVISADHGCDPTWPGTDHTREHIPVIAYGEQVAPCFVGRRDTFADIGQSIASYLGITPLKHGVSFL